jgi:thiol-disulfide isomerase/thioredoxin
MIKNLFALCFAMLMLAHARSAPLALIEFKLPPHQTFRLQYKNLRVQDLRLVFSNQSDRDSVINFSIDLPIYTAMYYGMSMLKNNVPISFQNTFYLKNGDTVLLETDKEFQLVSKTRSNPIINPIIHCASDFFSATGQLFYRMQTENINKYYKDSETMYFENLRRIDSIWKRKEVDLELKEIFDKHAAMEYEVMVLQPVLRKLNVPVQYAGKIKVFGERLVNQPALVANLDRQTALNYFNTYCRYEIVKAGHSISLGTLAAQAFKSKWSKPVAIAYAAQCMESETKKDDAVFKATYQSLLTYAGKAYAPQLKSLQKKYFPNISHKSEIIFLNVDGSSTTLMAELQKNKGRLMVIDFWASWCVPCREAFPDLMKMKLKFKNRKVTFIGLSLDADTQTQAWIAALKQEMLYGQPNQFKLKNTKSSPLFDGIDIPTIPRYIVLGSKGELLNSDFYGPQQKEFAVTLNKYLQQAHL